MAEINGWNYLFHETLGSTNDEAQKYCLVPNRKTIVRAETQTSGRGRRGRKWISDKGNLFFSMALEFELKNIGSLVLISALSIAQTLEELDNTQDIKLKWPNDVLLNRKKVSGILIEKGNGNYMIVGIGINIVSSPDDKDLIYPTTSLAQCKINCTADKFLNRFMIKFEQNLSLVQQNKKDYLQNEWLQRASNLGKEILVHGEKKDETGFFAGIDENMCLLLKQNNQIKKIMVGDVFLIKDDNYAGI